MMPKNRAQILFFLLPVSWLACTYTSASPGVELAWRFSEQNTNFGTQELRLRSCNGALVDRIQVALFSTPQAPPRIQFSYACDESVLAASDPTGPFGSFIALSEGANILQVSALDTNNQVLAFEHFEIDPSHDHSIIWEPVFPMYRLQVQAPSAAGCSQFSARLFYADASEQLLTPTVPADQINTLGPFGNEPVDYRSTLVTSTGAPLNGQPHFCNQWWVDAEQGFVLTNVDRGHYRLEYQIDGGACQGLHIEVADDTTIALDSNVVACESKVLP